MSNLETLNLNVEEESKEASKFDVLPAGDYNVIVSQAEMKDNKSGNGQYVSVTVEVIDGDLQGRLLWHNFNVQNANPTAEKIGRAELASLCKAIGVANPKDTDDLKDKPFVARVGFDKKDPSRNVVKAFIMHGMGVENAAPAVAASATAAKPDTPASNPTAGKKPWQR